MTIITSEELSKFRRALQDNDDAIEALDIIENCDGNLQESMNIIMNMDKDSYRGDEDWIDFENLAKSLRKFICNPAFESAFIDGSFAVALGYLLANTTHPTIFLVPFMLYVFKLGLEHFCQSQQSC
jgi:hypothetical protein